MEMHRDVEERYNNICRVLKMEEKEQEREQTNFPGENQILMLGNDEK